MAEPPSHSVGRPTLRTPANREKILAQILSGIPKSCTDVVSYSLLKEWQAEDPTLLEEMQQAENAYFDKLRKEVQGGTLINGVPDWRAAAFLLERRDKTNYGKPDAKAASLTVNNTANITVVLSPEQLANLQERRRVAMEGLTGGRN